MRRPGVTGLVIAAINLPWLTAWGVMTWHAGRGPADVPALLLLLLIGMTLLVAAPCLLAPGFTRKRWLLFAILAGTALFWFLQWIDAYGTADGDSDLYMKARGVIILKMALSGLVILTTYAAIDGALNLWRRRR